MKKIILLGILAFIISAVWLLPLAIVKPYAEKYIPDLKLNGVNGTLWKGSATSLNVKNTDFGSVEWKLKPLKSLTSLSLFTEFDIHGRLLTATGKGGINTAQTLTLENTNFKANADLLNNFQKQVKLSGDLIGTFKAAKFIQNELPELNGVIDWEQGALSSPLLSLAAGNYNFTISSEKDGLLIIPTSKDAPLELSGNVKLGKDWMYIPQLKVKSNNPGISNMLKFAGTQQPDGTTSITKSVDLKPYLKL